MVFYIDVKISPILSSKFSTKTVTGEKEKTQSISLGNKSFENMIPSRNEYFLPKDLAADKCSFLGKTDRVNKDHCSTGNFLVKGHSGIPCASCGKTMITYKEMLSFADDIKNARGDELREILLTQIDNYKPMEKKVVGEVIKILKERKKSSLSDVIKILAKEHMINLEDEQLKILSEIEEQSRYMSKSDNAKMVKFTEKTKRLILRNDDNRPFKRKTLLNEMTVQGEYIDNKAQFQKLYKIAESLPTSSDSISAFFVKYSRRASEKIAERLLLPATSTAEHIKPQADEGENKLSNYLTECSYCNTRRGHMPLREWIEDYQPDMNKNVQKYFDEITARIRNGEFPLSYIDYPKKAAKTIREESGGLIAPRIRPSIGQAYGAYLESLSDNY